MAISALLQFTQGSNVGSNGQALVVTAGTVVVLSNSDNSSVQSYRLEVCYAPPESAYAFEPGVFPPTVIAEGNGVPAFNFLPETGVYGCYRFRLTTWSGPGFTGQSDVDIRCIAVPFPNGLIAPPYQKFPDPLPLLGSGTPGAKPGELNFGGQPYGWQGDEDPSRPLLWQALQAIGGGGSVFSVTNPVVGDGTAGSPLGLALADSTLQITGSGLSVGQILDANVSGSAGIQAYKLAPLGFDPTPFPAFVLHANQSGVYWSPTVPYDMAPGGEGTVFMVSGGVANWEPQGAITHGNLSGLDSDDHVQYLLASGARALSGDLSAGSHKITNLATPTAPADAATKGYADSLAVTAGNGLTGTASFSVVAADGTITVSSAGVKVGSIGATNIAAGAVTLAKFDTTGATGTVLIGEGSGNPAQFSASPTVTALLAGASTASGTTISATGLTIGNAVAAPTISQTNESGTSQNGYALTIQAQNATGTTSTGGNLVLTSGTGTTAAGNLLLQTGGTTHGALSSTELNLWPGGGTSSTGNMFIRSQVSTAQNSAVYFNMAPSSATASNYSIAVDDGGDVFINSYGTYVYFSVENTQVLTAGVTGTSITGYVAATTFVSTGALPATTGALRLTNNTALNYRNAANTADLSALSVDANNHFNVGPYDLTQLYSTVVEDPSGWVLPGFANTACTVSVVAGTRTLTVAPTGTNYTYYIQGQLYTSTSKSVVWTATEGQWYFYFDTSGTLQATQNATVWASVVQGAGALVAVLYWDNTDHIVLLQGEERHGTGLSGPTHAYLHTYFHTQYNSGLALGNFTIQTGGAEGSSNPGAQFSITNGTAADEDIVIPITNGSPQTLSATAQIPIFYLSGATPVWRKKTADNYPLIQSGAAGYSDASGRCAYNQLTGGSWQLTVCPDNYLFHVYYYVTNDVNTPVIGVLGQAVYANAAAADTAVSTEAATVLSFLSTLSTEYKLVAAVQFQTKASFGNAVKAAVVNNTAGASYYDYRQNGVSAGIGAAGTNIAYSSLTGQPTLTGIAPVKVGGVSGAGQTLLTNLNVEIDGGGVANTVLAGAASGDGAYTPTPVVSTIAATASIAFTTPGLITLPGWLAFTGPAERTAQTGVGVIKHISANQAVVTPSGLQHEPASTNYCYLTETLGSWTRNVATDYADGLLDPAGGTAASDIGVASASNINGIYVSLGGWPLVSTTMAFSVWAQTSAAPNTAALDGLTPAQTIITSSTRAALTSTWQRVSAPYSGASASLVYMFLGAPSISRAKYAFPQYEALPWSTSYIPNTAGSGSASRAATTLVAALGSTVSAQLDLTFAAAMPSAYACTVLSDGTCTIGFDASGHGVSFFNSETITGSHAYVWAVGDTVRVVVQCSGTTNTWRLFVYVNGVIQIVGGELFTHTGPFAFSTANLYVASNGLTGHIPMAGITAIASTSAVVMLGNGTVVNIQAPRNANDATPKYYVDQTTYLNVRQYGIVPGTSDNIDTEITALLAGVFPSGGSTDSGAPTLYFPAGHYRVGATIAPPDSASNFDIVGDGSQATFFDWYGPGAVPVITLTNARKVGLKRFGVVPKINNPSVGVQVFGRISTRVGAAGTMGCVFEDMHVEACTQGFLVNAATAADGNNEGHRFVRCELLACGDGISWEQANSRGNTLYSCMFESNTRSAINNACAVQSYASLLLGGSYAAYDSHFSLNALSFRVGTSLDLCQVYGCICEGDNAFFQTPIQMASDFSGTGFTMTACSWQGADHTSVFNAAGAGYFLDLVGCQISSPTGVAWSFPTAGSGVGFHGGMQSFPSGAGAAMSVANKVQLFGLRTSTASPSVTLIGAGSVTEYGTHIF